MAKVISSNMHRYQRTCRMDSTDQKTNLKNRLDTTNLKNI